MVRLDLARLNHHLGFVCMDVTGPSEAVVQKSKSPITFYTQRGCCFLAEINTLY